MGCRLSRPDTTCFQGMGLKLKKAWDIGMFIVNNVALNGGDVVSDGMTAYALSKY